MTKIFKRFLTLTASSAAVAATLVSPALAAPSDFISTWVNTNPNTRGITHFVVTSDGNNKSNIQVFGKCHPSDCDWGKTTLVQYGSNVQDTNYRSASASYNNGFAHNLLILNLQGNKAINFQSFTQFVDNSGRQNYSSIERFKR